VVGIDGGPRTSRFLPANAVGFKPYGARVSVSSGGADGSTRCARTLFERAHAGFGASPSTAITVRLGQRTT